MTYPDRVSAPKEYEDGLERELGGPNAVRVSYLRSMIIYNIDDDRHEKQEIKFERAGVHNAIQIFRRNYPWSEWG